MESSDPWPHRVAKVGACSLADLNPLGRANATKRYPASQARSRSGPFLLFGSKLTRPAGLPTCLSPVHASFIPAALWVESFLLRINHWDSRMPAFNRYLTLASTVALGLGLALQPLSLKFGAFGIESSKVLAKGGEGGGGGGGDGGGGKGGGGGFGGGGGGGK